MDRPDYLDREGVPIDLMTWAHLLDDREYAHIARTKLDCMLVSTVWLGLDHSYRKDAPPLIFETMLFGGPMRYEVMGRYATEAEAEAGHEHAVTLARHQREMMTHGQVKQARDEQRARWNGYKKRARVA